MATTQSTPTADPFAAIATPIAAPAGAAPATATPAASADPFAAIATPIPPEQPGMLSRAWEGAKQFAAPVVALVKPPWRTNSNWNLA